MRNMRGFRGLLTGDETDDDNLTPATWGEASAQEDDPSIWDEDKTPGTGVRINVIQSAHRVAPEGAYFSLTLTGFNTNTLSAGHYDPSYHDKYVFWDYGDAYDFQAPIQVLAVDAADGGNRKNARYSRGPMGSHVFRRSGVYTVRVAVLEAASGKIGFGSVQITVGDPDSYYPSRSTLFVDTTRSFRNAPRGAQVFSSIDDALQTLNRARTPHRVVLERGQVHTISSTFNYRPPANASATSLRIEAAEGSGARPIIRAGSRIKDGDDLIFDSSMRRLTRPVKTGAVLRGVDFQGPWDPASLSGRSIDCFEFNGNQSCKHAVFDDCRFSGWGRTFFTRNTGGSAPDRTIFFNDIAISNWTTCGFFGGFDSVLSFAGCGFVQDVHAITRQTPDSNSTLSPIRITSARMCNFWACDLFSSTGWSRYGGLSAVQPGLRWNNSPTVRGAMLNMQACVTESGQLALSLKPQTRRQARLLVNGLVEGNIAISGFQSNAVVHCAFGGMTFRNNIFVLAGRKDSSSIGGQDQAVFGFIYFDGGEKADPSNEATPIKIYNNTYVNLTGKQALPVADRIGMSRVVQHNDLMHQPMHGAPYTGLKAIPVFKARYRGYRPDAKALYKDFANPVESGSLWIPQLTSPALGNALSEPSSSIDFRGERRPEPPSLGAIESD